MSKRTHYCLLITILMITGLAHAQQTGKVFRIGFLDANTASGMAVLVDAFRQELSKVGWIEGKNVTIEYRFSEGNLDRVPELAADLVRLKFDLIVTAGVPPAVAGEESDDYGRQKASAIECAQA